MLMLRVGVYVCFPVGLRARSCVHVWSNMFVQCLLPVRCVFACACACARPPPAANRKIRKLIDRNFGPYVKTGALSLVASAVSVKDRSAGSKPAGLMPPIFYFSKFSNMTSFSVRIFGVLSFFALGLYRSVSALWVVRACALGHISQAVRPDVLRCCSDGCFNV